jgi:hypothetical protein
MTNTLEIRAALESKCILILTKAGIARRSGRPVD